MTARLSLPEARAVALQAQGLLGSPLKTVSQAIDHLGLLQIDSVNVFERAHYMPLFSRLGNFNKDDLEHLTQGFNPPVIEYWAHEASFIRSQDWGLFRWRMREFARSHATKSASWVEANRELLGWLVDEMRDRGPLTVSDFEHEQKSQRRGNWWGWSDVKIGLWHLFSEGKIASAGRQNFTRRYALLEQVLPREVYEAEVPELEARHELLRRAASAIGVGTVKDLADYYRFNNVKTKAWVADLVDSGYLTEVAIDGWAEPAFAPTALLENGAFASSDAHSATTLLSPFDPVVWHRPRNERLFDFHYRIEIYTPEPKRVYGYYTLPILWRNRVVGRVDLKSDRQADVLRVQSAWHEDGASGPGATSVGAASGRAGKLDVGGQSLSAAEVAELAHDLAANIRVAAAWQGLPEIWVAKRATLRLPSLLNCLASSMALERTSDFSQTLDALLQWRVGAE